MLPLSGMRVIAIEQYGAGPYGTMQLADLGAEVIKIENPADGGDMGRRVGPFFLGPDDSHFFESFNRNKKSITLDLKRDGAREVLLALARDADGLLNNLRGDLADTLGLTYEALKEANPRIVCAHLSAYGRSRAARKLAGLRLSDAGRGRISFAHRGTRRATQPNGPLDCRYDDWPVRGVRFALRHHRRARRPGSDATLMSACSTARCKI